MAAVTQTRWLQTVPVCYLTASGGQKSPVGPAELESRRRLGCVPSGGAGENPSPASRCCLRSLARGFLPAKVCAPLTSASIITSSPLTLLFASHHIHNVMPLGSLDNPGQTPPVKSLMSSAKSLLSLEETYSQVPGIRMQTSLGGLSSCLPHAGLAVSFLPDCSTVVSLEGLGASSAVTGSVVQCHATDTLSPCVLYTRDSEVSKARTPKVESYKTVSRRNKTEFHKQTHSS